MTAAHQGHKDLNNAQLELIWHQPRNDWSWVHLVQDEQVPHVHAKRP